MGLQTITFKVDPPRAGNGFSLPEGSDIPKMKGRSKLDLTTEIKALTEALEDLSNSICSFWSCEGPNKSKDMCTCRKCWAMRKIAGVRQTLINQL